MCVYSKYYIYITLISIYITYIILYINIRHKYYIVYIQKKKYIYI